jgi:hypothetical protein
MCTAEAWSATDSHIESAVMRTIDIDMRMTTGITTRIFAAGFARAERLCTNRRSGAGFRERNLSTSGCDETSEKHDLKRASQQMPLNCKRYARHSPERSSFRADVHMQRAQACVNARINSFTYGMTISHTYIFGASGKPASPPQRMHVQAIATRRKTRAMYNGQHLQRPSTLVVVPADTERSYLRN